jgi:large subunit ribosomal protein L10
LGLIFSQEDPMALTLEAKQAMVAEVHAVAREAVSVVAAEYRGLTVSQITGLRAKARQSGVYLRVVKNTLARRAVSGTEFECIAKSLKGPLILAFSTDDPGAAARVVKDFAKGTDIEKVASLPTRDEALSMLLGVFIAPISKFVRTLAAPHTKFVRTVAAVKDQKVAAAA